MPFTIKKKKKNHLSVPYRGRNLKPEPPGKHNAKKILQTGRNLEQDPVYKRNNPESQLSRGKEKERIKNKRRISNHNTA